MPEPAEGAASDPETSNALLERRDRLAVLDEILANLPLEQRAVFMLFEIEGKSGKEIAAILGVPVGTVRSRLRLARDTFQRAVIRLRARRGLTPLEVGSND